MRKNKKRKNSVINLKKREEKYRIHSYIIEQFNSLIRDMMPYFRKIIINYVLKIFEKSIS
ncbi:hypothetical protein [Clostridium beijerinckii]|jgi:hypothetical protein|uniref:Uncharacterized protein n=1 Tax=Clostridium beijerinckii TaxID=1520 RepID=A0AAE2RVU5_CLOBE|nr:hypothetical protein [Clostridium beijerinckii]MBF7811576.1 hypothetical protein [Clostridium beijerinckii]MBF7811931.1 hypothetical protein [Clostridium beijerinckii]NRT25216.1 hypothetical protein [Clostridium beijerinckii]NRT67190.1 hypothetical protein [Clostridium beijerinckii]NRT81311.1 hypothetical protein [Clostridium beijerinckii]